MNPLRKYKEESENYNQKMESGETVKVCEVQHANVNYPISGYRGFIQGKKAQNKHGKTYRQTLKELKYEQLTKNV